MDGKVTEASKETMALLMERVIKQGMRPKTALQLSDDVMEGIYGHAYNLYNRGMYSEASHIFRLLILLDPTAGKYLMGLAACLHMMKLYDQAIGMYLLAAALDLKNPLPHYHAADCFIKLDSPGDASLELMETIEVAKKQPQYKVLVERAQLMIESLEPEVRIKQEEYLKARAEADKKAHKETEEINKQFKKRREDAQAKVKKRKKPL